MSIGNLFSIGDVPKEKKTKCEELSVLKTMQAITRFACIAVLVKQLKYPSQLLERALALLTEQVLINMLGQSS